MLKTSFIKKREKIQSVLYVNEPFSGNVKMVIATSNDEINYRNLFVVPSANEPWGHIKDSIWTWFESDKWIKLGRPQIVRSSTLLSMRNQIWVLKERQLRNIISCTYNLFMLKVLHLKYKSALDFKYSLHFASWFFDGRKTGATGVGEALSHVLDPDVGATEGLQQLTHPVSVREGTQHRPQPLLLLLDNNSWNFCFRSISIINVFKKQSKLKKRDQVHFP